MPVCDVVTMLERLAGSLIGPSGGPLWSIAAPSIAYH